MSDEEAAPTEDEGELGLKPSLEAVLMIADQPLDHLVLAQAVGSPPGAVRTALEELSSEYTRDGRGFDLREVGGGWRFYSRADFAPLVEQFLVEGQQARLTQAALETLAVVAYRQPVTRARVSAIRGVNVDGVMRTLVARGLVEEAGTDAEFGAHQFRTTSYFLERMGLKNLGELPEIAPFLPEMDDMPAMDSEPVFGTRGPPTLKRWNLVGEADQAGLRLQKVLAQAGVASRRRCETLMAEGLVEVDGEVITQLGARVDPEAAVIRVDGVRIPVAQRHVYLVAHKPRGVVSTMKDDEGRRDLTSLLGAREERLFHVGRLDTDTDGLIVLTNDGEFAHRLAHPSYELQKTYVAQVEGVMKARARRDVLVGVELEDGPVKADAFRVMNTQGGRSVVELVIHEGRNHIVRRLLARVGHPVLRLSRTAIGPIRIGSLKSGAVRELTSDELGTLLDAMQL